MTTPPKNEPHTLPADTDSTTDPIDGLPTGAPDASPGEGVNAMASRWSRRSRRKRAWDEMSETDRQVLLESVRQRRRAQAVHDAQDVQAWTARMHR